MRPEYWELAKKHPDIAYQWMLNDPKTWLVVEPGSEKRILLEPVSLEPSQIAVEPISGRRGVVHDPPRIPPRGGGVR